jgi:glycosyltransferase involved in cell wall biosynthesis
MAMNRVHLRRLAAQRPFVLGASPGLLGEWIERGVPVERTTVVPNPIATRAIPARPDRGVRSSTRRLVTVGRLTRQKRHDLLIRAVAIVSERMPVELTIVGDGELAADLKALAAQLGVSARVHFAGYAPRPHEYIRRAELFVLASDYEGFGNVLVEALACGVPVVATDVPYGPAFILDDPSYGVLVEPGDPRAIASGIIRALDRAENADVSSAARRRAEAFDATKVAGHFDDVVAAAVAGRPLPPWTDARRSRDDYLAARDAGSGQPVGLRSSRASPTTSLHGSLRTHRR